MSATLALSAYPGDAVFGIGALLAALPGERHHLTAFAEVREEAAANAEPEAAALARLGAAHTALRLASTASTKTVRAALANALDRAGVANVLLPLPLAARPGEDVLAEVVPELRRAHPGVRFLHYYPLPLVTQHRARFPELAFARPIRGLAEADGDAGLLQWKPRRGATPTDGGPLPTKLAACDLLRATLSRRLYTDDDLPPPADPEERAAARRRAIGTREWVQLA